jgi:4-amino-4-deoxy-L-arabinose transferase-like glycosyltransferase
VLFIGLVLVIAVSGWIIFDCLGCASFFGDEAIYANVSLDTLQTGVWLPLHYDGRPYFDKPPLKITLVTVLFKFFGVGELIARLPDGLFGVATIALTYLLAARWYGVATGLLAAAVLLGAESYIIEHGVRDSCQDSLITLLASIVLWAWIRVREDIHRRRFWWWAAALSAMSVGLCKNMLGILFGLVILAIEILPVITHRRRTESFVAALKLVMATVVVFALYSVVMIPLTGGQYTRKLYEDVFVRATTGLDPGHLNGPGFYLQRLAGDFGWWLLLLAPALVVVIGFRRRDRDTSARFLSAWVVLVVAGFSVPVSKLPWYIYPAYPALSLVVAVGGRELMRLARWRFFQAALASVLLLLAAIRVAGVARAVERDVTVIDTDRFARSLATLEGAQLVVDEHSIKPLGRLREWNRYYLESVPGVTWVRRKGDRFEADPDGCVYLACGSPGLNPPSSALPWRPIMRVRTSDPLAAPLWILGTCDLDVPGTVGSDAVFWEGLIAADGFEGGDLRGWESTDDHASDSVDSEIP